MEQRTLRLGDIVDDYCPRERRLTNHAIVALVGQEIRQTRCATCDAEHDYKEGRMPKKKILKPEPVLAAPAPSPAAATPAPAARLSSGNGRADDVEMPAIAVAAAPAGNGQAHDVVLDDEPATDREEAWHDGLLAQRSLIRATLPKTVGGEPPPRPIPEFTMHQRQPVRGGQHGFRHGQPPRDGHGNGLPRGDGEPDGNRPPRAGRRRRRRRPRG